MVRPKPERGNAHVTHGGGQEWRGVMISATSASTMSTNEDNVLGHHFVRSFRPLHQKRLLHVHMDSPPPLFRLRVLMRDFTIYYG